MDRKELYERLRKLKDPNGKNLFGKDTIEKLEALTEQNLQYYVDYLMHLIDTNDFKSFKTYRSKHLDLLKYISSIGCDLLNITQEIVEDYFAMYSHEDIDTTNTRVYYIKKLFKFFNIEIDIEKYIVKDNQNEDKMPRIKAEEFSKARFFYRKIRSSTPVDSDKYIVATKKLFVLEMFFYTPLRKEYVGDFFREQGSYDDKHIYFHSKKYPVPKSLISLIKEMRESDGLYDTLDVETMVGHMKIDLAKYNMGNLSSKGAEKTTKTIFWTCPQCGEKYLAIADNWCVMQYTSGGEHWVVCRDNCAKNIARYNND